MKRGGKRDEGKDDVDEELDDEVEEMEEAFTCEDYHTHAAEFEQVYNDAQECADLVTSFEPRFFDYFDMIASCASDVDAYCNSGEEYDQEVFNEIAGDAMCCYNREMIKHHVDQMDCHELREIMEEETEDHGRERKELAKAKTSSKCRQPGEHDDDEDHEEHPEGGCGDHEDHPEGDHEEGDHPEGDHEEGDHPEGDHEEGDHEEGDHEEGDRPRRERPAGGVLAKLRSNRR